MTVDSGDDDGCVGGGDAGVGVIDASVLLLFFD